MSAGITPLPRFFTIAFLLCWCSVAGAEPLVLEVKQAKAEIQSPGREPVVFIVFVDASARAFAEFTSKNVGKAVDMRVDGRSLMKPVVREPILGGTVTISGRFSRSEVDEIVARLSSGAAKLEIEVVE